MYLVNKYKHFCINVNNMTPDNKTQIEKIETGNCTTKLSKEKYAEYLELKKRVYTHETRDTIFSQTFFKKID